MAAVPGENGTKARLEGFEARVTAQLDQLRAEQRSQRGQLIGITVTLCLLGYMVYRGFR